jgi:hypothetical protein
VKQEWKRTCSWMTSFFYQLHIQREGYAKSWLHLIHFELGNVNPEQKIYIFSSSTRHFKVSNLVSPAQSVMHYRLKQIPSGSWSKRVLRNLLILWNHFNQMIS